MLSDISFQFYYISTAKAEQKSRQVKEIYGEFDLFFALFMLKNPILDAEVS